MQRSARLVEVVEVGVVVEPSVEVGHDLMQKLLFGASRDGILQRQGLAVARCTVERSMRANGWRGVVRARKVRTFVRSAIGRAAALRAREGRPRAGSTIHHSDAGSRYTSVKYGEKLSLSDSTPSIGSVGDAYGNALAETTIGLYKTEAVREDSPFRRGPLTRLADVEVLTADRVGWYNTTRLMHRLDRKPPVECEADYYVNCSQQPAADR